jgi:Thermolysin metallopeptidase, alpha-helical domain/Thermolysin metallopeptidase, catalytic domain
MVAETECNLPVSMLQAVAMEFIKSSLLPECSAFLCRMGEDHRQGGVMPCTFVPPYLLQRIALWAGTTEASASGRETLQVDDRLRAKRESRPPEMAAPRLPGVRSRVVHTANNSESLPGEPVRSDGDPPVGDPAVDEAFDSSGQALELFASQFRRRSIDGRGGTVSITVHYGRDYDNAFWDGTQLVFGDGDGQIFERFTKPMDVMAHEFTHGVTQFTVGLAYQDQPGALNESISDVFASMAKQRALGQTAAEANWLIAEGLFMPGINARALRSMKEPGTAYDDPQIGRDLQVGSMADYVHTDDDSGGVHINSGIPNRAFALSALAIGGPSWEKPGQVWYDTLVNGELSAQASFESFAHATVSAAGRLYPNDQSIAEKIRAAWQEVGLLQMPPSDLAASEYVAAAFTQGRGSVDPAGSPGGADLPGTVAVRRSGGFAGTTKVGQLDLNSDPAGPEVRYLLMRVGRQQISAARPAPDRFTYTVEYGDWRFTVPEQDLTPELRRLVQVVLNRGG